MRFLSLLLALQQAQVHRKQNLYASSIAFSSLEVLNNDVSMDNVVGLVVLIPMSPRSSKSESER